MCAAEMTASCGTGSSETETAPAGGRPIEPRPIRVLVVEGTGSDCPIIRKTIDLMDSFRADVRRAQGLSDMRLTCGSEAFDVALVDVCSGREPGKRAVLELGGHIGGAVLILLTDTPGQELPEAALEAGAFHYLAKNQLTPALLESTIRSALHAQALEMRLEELTADLERATRAKSEFFARISHDLKTPLNAILGNAELISTRAFNESIHDKYLDCAQSIQLAGTQLLEVLDNLIHHAASQGPCARGRFHTVDLNELTRRAVDMTAILAKSRNHVVDVKYSNAPALVDCQPFALTQAIMNLISNAVKYTPAGGAISVQTICDRRHCSIAIRDNGLGMSREDVDVALLPFGRVELPAKHAQDGTGIGLPIVRDVVAMHAGQLQIESAPGQGTEALIRLPAAQEDRIVA